jgi:adenylate cyclase
MVKSLGDGMLVEFESTLDAVECAFAIRQRIDSGEGGQPVDRRIQLRMGIHLGDVLADDIDLYGDGVNLAARLLQLGGPQEIVVSASVRDQLTNNLGLSIEDMGERQLKGFDRPTRAYRIWPLGGAQALAPARARRQGQRPSIAVLPFRNLSGDQTHEFLGELIAEDLIGDMSRLTDLFVISRLSTSPFRNRPYEPRGIADALGVRYVLSGSLQTSGKRMRVRAELTEAEAGHAIWSERFEGSLGDIFDIQDELAREIAKRVVPYVRQLELERARSKRPEDLTAYEHTLRAIDHMHRSSRDDLDVAKIMLESAIAAEPDFVMPRAWLAYWHVRRVGQGWSPDRRQDTIDAIRHADAALEIDYKDSWALSVHGLVAAYLQKDLEAAITRYDRALAINPSSAPAWVWSTSAYAWLGRGEEAVRRAPMAIELSPFDPNMYIFNSHAGSAYAVAGDYDRAIEFLRRSLRENRMFTASHKLLTISLALSGRRDEARKAAADLLVYEPGLTVRSFRESYPGSNAPYGPSFCDALAQAGIPP